MFTAIHAPNAPENDLCLIKKLNPYKAVNPEVAKIALKKMWNYLWYLAPERAALVFFEDSISVKMKQKMVENVRKEPEFQEHDRLSNRFKLIKQDYTVLDEDIDFFISRASMAFFKRLEIDYLFFDLHVSDWHLDKNYQSGLKIVEHLKIGNDVAERGIKIISEYNKRINFNKKQKQYVLQIIEQYNKLYPSVTKKGLTKPMVIG